MPKKYNYKTINVDGKKIDEHRHVMQVHLGRKLLRNEIVRHRDKDPLNNDIFNLYVVSRQEQWQEQIAECSVSTGRAGKKTKVKEPKPAKVKKVKPPKEKKGKIVAAKKPRRNEIMYAIKKVDTSNLIPLKMDRRTTIYVRPDSSPKEIERIINKHKNHINAYS